MKPTYDRHRRMKRYRIDGRPYGLPVIYRTWGQVYLAKLKGRKLEAFFAQAPEEGK